MKPVRIQINNQLLTVPHDYTIHQAAESLGINIPTLCFKKGLQHFTSCMLCVVYDSLSRRLIPSCSMQVTEGMQIETDSILVREARRDALEFLLAEHLGDCEAPCQRTCPAHLNIPLMLKQIQEKKFSLAIQTVKKTIALPAALGRICPAPCEKGCKRKYYDSSVSICLLKRFVADVDLAESSPYHPPVKSSTGKNIAIIGSGPAGLAAAYYLIQEGHNCTVYDKYPAAGGELRYSIDREKLPDAVLDAEIRIITDLGVKFILGPRRGKIKSFAELKVHYDAVIITIGIIKPAEFKDPEIKLSRQGILVDKNTYQSSVEGIFAGGGAIRKGKLAIRSLADGRKLSFSVNRFLHKNSSSPDVPFNSVMEKLAEDEIKGYLQKAGKYGRLIPEDQVLKGYTASEAVKESWRCLTCDCKKALSCKLRQHAAEYQANQPKNLGGEKNKFSRLIFDNGLIFEPGKCIKCGLCIRIVNKKKEKNTGIAFTNRGFDLLIKAPFNKSLARGLGKKAAECVNACPTAALAWQDTGEKEEDQDDFS